MLMEQGRTLQWTSPDAEVEAAGMTDLTWLGGQGTT
jgi:hypothetical protein